MAVSDHDAAALWAMSQPVIETPDMDELRAARDRFHRHILAEYQRALARLPPDHQRVVAGLDIPNVAELAPVADAGARPCLVCGEAAGGVLALERPGDRPTVGLCTQHYYLVQLMHRVCRAPAYALAVWTRWRAASQTRDIATDLKVFGLSSGEYALRRLAAEHTVACHRLAALAGRFGESKP